LFSNFWEPALWDPVEFFLMLILLFDIKNLEKFFWGKPDPFVNYFVKTRPNGYHNLWYPPNPGNYLAYLFIYFTV
jgi:hypothetical protein